MRKGLKRLFIGILITGILALNATSFAEQQEIKVFVDGTQVAFDTKPIIVQGRALIPMRAVSEALGAIVEWDGKTETITVTKEAIIIKLKVNDIHAKVNDSDVILEAAPLIVNGRTMVPIRFIGESLGAKVEWDGINNIVKLGTQTILQTTPVSYKPEFASYTSIPYTLPSVYQGYTLPVNLEKLKNYSKFSFNDSQKALLMQNGFVVIPARWNEFSSVYNSNSYSIPSFITTDSVYHIYHLIFDKMLRDLEREQFEPDIKALTSACLQTAQENYNELKGTELEDVARRTWAYFAIADGLINNSSVTPPEVKDLVESEMKLINSHSQMVISPLLSFPSIKNPKDLYMEDYSQYVPRGHYTTSEQLQRYFKTMMWYGHINLRLKIKDETKMALMITNILQNTTLNSTPMEQVWARIYDPTAFIVGNADDLGFHEYSAIADTVLGKGFSVSDIANDAKVDEFIKAASKLPVPKINSMILSVPPGSSTETVQAETQGFRFMGQRFVLDAYIFNQLLYPAISTPEKPRYIPKSLDVVAALGSDEAYSILNSIGETAYTGYPKQMDNLHSEITSLGLDFWTKSIYSNWLYSLQPLLHEKGKQYPIFMSTKAWERKNLQTALGSWTELKHDTILYAKQVMPSVGAAAPTTPPRGWVEPDPEVYARLLALTRMTKDGLESRKILSETTSRNLGSLDSLISFLLDVSQKELKGEPLTNDNYNAIKNYGSTLNYMILGASDKDPGGESYEFEKDIFAALVADVATNPNSENVLEEATGYINDIYVVVPDESGALQVAKGAVFSYYEFSWPMSNRLTDEAWESMLSGKNVPAVPAWTESFLAK